MSGKISGRPTISNLFNIDHMTIAIVTDASHVLKLIRNMLQNKITVKMSQEWQEFWGLSTNIIDWNVIEAVVEFQEKHELLINPKLKAKTIKRGKSSFGKMDVACAIHVYSKDTASAIEYMVLYHGYPDTMLATAQFVYEVAHWWEIISSQHFAKAFSLVRPEMYQQQCDEIEKFERFFSSIQINELGSGEPHAYTEVQQGVIMACYSTLWVAKRMINDLKVKFFMPGRLLGDPIETHHGQTRKCNKNPTSLQVEKINKSLAVCQVLGNVKHSNCQGDKSTMILGDFKNIKKIELMKIQEEREEVAEDIEFLKSNGIRAYDLNTDEGMAQANALAFWIGCVLKRTIKSKKHKGCYCENCITIFVEVEPSLQLVNELIECKSFSDKRKMIRPTKFGNDVLHEAEALYKLNRHLYLKKEKLDEKILSLILDELRSKFDLTKVCHIKHILKRFIFGRLHFWADYMNRNGRQTNEPAREAASNASRSARQMYLVE